MKILNRLVAIFSLAVLSGSLFAAPIVDQEFDPAGVGASQGLWSLTTDAQTFTVGITGILTGFDLLMHKPSATTSPNDINWGFQSTTSGLPDGSVLSSGILALADGPTTTNTNEFVHIDLTAGFGVTAGDVLAIVLNGTASHPDPVLRWQGGFNTGATYAGGEALKFRFGAWVPAHTTEAIDWGFRTYVETDIPEPSIIALFVAGLFGSGFARRKIRN